MVGRVLEPVAPVDVPSRKATVAVVQHYLVTDVNANVVDLSLAIGLHQKQIANPRSAFGTNKALLLPILTKEVVTVGPKLVNAREVIKLNGQLATVIVANQ